MVDNQFTNYIFFVFLIVMIMQDYKGQYHSEMMYFLITILFGVT